MLIYVGLIAVSLILGYGCFNKYPMDWQPLEANSANEFDAVRQDLLDLGFPEVVLNDMTPEEILACEGASFVVVEQRDYDVDQNRGIGTQEEIADGKAELADAQKELDDSKKELEDSKAELAENKSKLEEGKNE